MNFDNLYQSIISAYDKDDLDSFVDNINTIKNDHNFLFMLLLEIGIDVRSQRCYEYIINLIAINLSESELALILIINIRSPKLIFETKKINFKPHNELKLRLKSTDNDKYDKLLIHISESELDFTNTEKGLKNIEEWLDIIEQLIYRPLFDENKTKTYLACNESGDVIGKFTGVKVEDVGKQVITQLAKPKLSRRNKKKLIL